MDYDDDYLIEVVKRAEKERGGDPEGAARAFQAALRQVRGTEEDGDEVERTTDLGNARRLVRRHGAHLRYVERQGGWRVFDGKRWREDDTGEIERRAKDAVRAIYDEAANASTDADRKELAKWAIRSESASRLRNMEKLARTEPEVVARPSAFDRDPWLLNVENGTIRLRTMQLRQHDPQDYVTKIAPVVYDPDATAPLWLEFLERVMDERPDLTEFLQRAVGYSLTGETMEQCLFVPHGLGANGKTTFIEIIRSLLGDYAAQADPSTFLARRSDGPRNDVARLAGARFVSATETSEGRKLDDVMVKQMTGGDTVTARYLYKEAFEFRPTFKIWISTNHKPRVRGDDDAIWRRMRLIPFSVTIPPDEQDPNLVQKLRAELPGILNWALEGCMKWQEEGLGLPESVRAATQDYRDEMDVLGRFLDECCQIGPNFSVGATELFRIYKEWAEAAGEYVWSQTYFGKSLSERGFEKDRDSSTGRYLYFGLNSSNSSNSSRGTF